MPKLFGRTFSFCVRVKQLHPSPTLGSTRVAGSLCILNFERSENETVARYQILIMLGGRTDQLVFLAENAWNVYTLDKSISQMKR